MTLYRSALAYTILSTGITMIYYGTEQLFNGGNDPYCREPLWTTGFPTNTDMYKYLQFLISFKQQVEIWQYEQVERYVDDSFYCFSRGQAVLAVTNDDSQQIVRNVTYSPYAANITICNIFWPTQDCQLTGVNGEFMVYLNSGEVKVFLPSQQARKVYKRWQRLHDKWAKILEKH